MPPSRQNTVATMAVTRYPKPPEPSVAMDENKIMDEKQPKVTNDMGISEIIVKYPDAAFALFTSAPDAVSAAGEAFSEADLGVWHEKLWNVFSRDKSVIGFFAGRLTDARRGAGSAGLVTYNRKYIKEPFWFYQAQFSGAPFVKLCAAELAKVNTKKIDVKCYTNAPPVTLTVDGNEKRSYAGEKIYDGVYVFRKVALKNKVSTLEAACAGDGKDTAQVAYEKK